MRRNTSLQLKDGKFFRDGQLVPTEFGNKEQIRLMNERLQYVNDLTGEGYEVDPDITVSADINFECICGSNVSISIETMCEDDVSNAFNGEKERCRSCQRQYKVHRDAADYLYVKLIK